MLLRVTCVMALLGSTGALAQAGPIPTFELERFTLNAGARESMTVSSADLLEARRLKVTLAGHYAHQPLMFSIDDRPAGAVVSSRVTAHLAVAYGIVDWFEAGLQLPVVAFQQGDDLTSEGIAPVASAGLGAPLLQARAAFLRQDRDQPLDLGLSLSLTLPLGSSEALARDPGLGLAVAPQLGAGRSFGPVRVGGQLGASIRGTSVLSPTSTVIADEIGSSFTFGAAVNTTRALHFVRGELGVRGAVPFTRSQASVEILGGVRASFLDDALEVFALGGPGLGRTPGTPAFRLLLGISWAPSFSEKKGASKACAEADASCSQLDSDEDGIADADDSCPRTRGIAARQGCPDTDADADGVLDSIDACPKEAGPSEQKGCP